jgi:hypothetical protein
MILDMAKKGKEEREGEVKLQHRVFSTPVQLAGTKKVQNEMVGNWVLGKVRTPSE